MNPAHGEPPQNSAWRTASLTVLAMLAFAANSLLCRMALGGGLIDAASFTTVRMSVGGATLLLFVLPRWLRGDRSPVDWRMVLMLFAYMAFFSFAYLTLSAGTGALLLFGAVQLTMFLVALRAGERLNTWGWLGVALAAAGLVYLVLPGLSAPHPLGAAMMTLAGVAWGVYSLLGRGAARPLDSTAANFVFAVPLVLVLSLATLRMLQVTPAGLALAALSGAVTSGLGYVIWYAALRGLSTGRAATVQLSVPVIAALGGVLLLDEELTVRLFIASVATLGGIALVLAQRSRSAASKPGESSR